MCIRRPHRGMKLNTDYLPDLFLGFMFAVVCSYSIIQQLGPSLMLGLGGVFVSFLIRAICLREPLIFRPIIRDHKNINPQKVGYVRTMGWKTPLTKKQSDLLDAKFGPGDYE